MSYLEKLADKYLDELFQSSNVSRANLQSQSSFSMRRDFDPYITPYSLSMEVRNTTTNIANIAQTPVVSNLIIGSFPIEQLQAALKLQEVKKVREFVQSTSQKTPQPKVTKPKAIKRTQVESSVSSTTPAPPMMMMESKKFRTGLPLNFYEIVGPLFQEFWRMKFSNEVNCAFFAKITINNCREYGLDAFAQHSSSLPTIKEKLQNRTYLSVEDFENDFHQLCSNVLKYYPEEHEARKIAIDIRKNFLSKWPLVKEQLRWS